ncbi:hypothetical protein ES319_A06G076300v1 [Gossypium barbadense]|uniref:Uncharacterized protein n=1 Tax=Gossypium barbadense TaxID=3634 RepID=A0A5J5VBB4_GOSBA|nr:hypothetical protein ES319_A06G076300v1 [Gossypium barbadense]
MERLRVGFAVMLIFRFVLNMVHSSNAQSLAPASPPISDWGNS